MNFPYIILAYSSLFVLGIIDNARGPIYSELLKEFSISNSSGSLLFSLCSLMGFFISLISHHWLSRFGAIKATRLALVTDILACILMATAKATIDGYVQMLLSALVLGLGMGIKGITLNLIIKKASTENNRRQLFSGLHTMYGAASVIGPVIIGKMFAQNIDWRVFFQYIAFIPAIILFYSFKVIDYDYANKHLNKAEFSSKIYFLPGAIFAFYVSSEILISSRLSIYLSEVHAYSKVEASYWLSVFFITLLIGRIGSSFLKFSMSSYQIIKISLILSLLFTFLALLFYPPLLALNGLSMSIFFPYGMDWLSHKFLDKSDFVISRVMTMVGGFLVAMHYLFGLLSDLIGMDQSIWILPIYLLLSWYLLHFKTKHLTI